MDQSQCLNCEQDVSGNYCTHCGQKKSTHRFTLNHVFTHDVIHGFTHMDKGILFTAKELFVRPGYSIREYIEGKRASHFNYVTMLLLLIATQVFIQVTGNYHMADILPAAPSGIIGEIQLITQKYAKPLYLISILIASVGTYIVFGRTRQNFAEHLVMNVYRECGALMITCTALLIIVVAPTRTMAQLTQGLEGVAMYIYTFRFYRQYFKQDYDNKFELAFRVVIAQLILPLAIVLLVLCSRYILQHI